MMNCFDLSIVNFTNLLSELSKWSVSYKVTVTKMVIFDFLKKFDRTDYSFSPR